MAETKEKLVEAGRLTEITRERQDTGQGELVDVVKSREAEVPREVEGWLEKVEMAGGDNGDTPTLTPGKPTGTAIPAAPNITTVSFSRGQFVAGFKKRFSDAGRWLSAFWLRIIKIKQGRVKFREE